MASHQDNVGHERELRSSFEIMGCHGNNGVSFAHGIGPNLSRPPSSMPDFDNVVDDNTTLPEEAQVTEESEDEGQRGGAKALIQLIMSVALLAFSVLSITATGAVMTVLNQVGKAVPVGYTVWLVLSIAILVFSIAGLGHILYGSPEFLARIARRPQAFRWTIGWPSVRWRVPRFSVFRRQPTAQSNSQSPGHLPHPKEFELDDLENQPRRPPTPYPGPSRPVPIHAPQGILRDNRPQTLPFGFPVPPTGIANRISSAVSRMSNMSFQSAPRTVSPLSDSPPTPPPKEPTVSRFQSREPLLPPAASGDAVAQSDTRASILTTLCDAVQLSNPGDDEPGPSAPHYSPLAAASSPATGTPSRDSASIQSPKPAYPIELASPSRGREHED